MTRTQNSIFRIILTVLFGTAAVFVFYYAMTRIHLTGAISQIEEEMKESVAYVKEAYANEKLPYDSMKFSIQGIYEEDAAMLATLPEADPEFAVTDEYLAHLNDILLVQDVMIMDSKGHVLAAASGVHADLTSDEYAPLKETFETGITARKEFLAEMSFREAFLETLEETPALQEDATEAAPALQEDATEAAPALQEDAAEAVPALQEDATEAAPALQEDVDVLTELTEDYCTLYARAYDEDRAFILKAFNLLDEAYLTDMTVWDRILENETVGRQGFLFVWSDETGRLFHYPDSDLNGQGIDAVGIDPDEIEDGWYGWKQVNGGRMYLHTAFFEEEGVWIACAVPEEDLEQSNRFIRVVLCIVFALFSSALVYYVILLLRQKSVRVLSDFTRSGKTETHKSRQYKLLVLTALLILILFAFHFFLLTMYLLSAWAEAAGRQTVKIERNISEQEKAARSYVELFNVEKQHQLDLFAHMIDDNPDLCVSSKLDEYSYVLEVFDIHILDPSGQVISATSTMAYPPDSTINVQNDTAGLLADPAGAAAAQDNEKPLSEWMTGGRIVLLPIPNEEGTSTGYLFVRYYSVDAKIALESFSHEQILRRIQPGRSGFVFSVDPETKTFSFYPKEEMMGREVLEYGLTENEIKDNYCDFISIDGVSYYAVTDMVEDMLIYYVVPESKLLSQRMRICLLTMLVAAALFFVTGIALYTSREQIEVIQPEEERHAPREDQNSPEYRVIRMLLYYAVGCAGVLAAYSSIRTNLSTGGVLEYVLSGKWEPGMNVFALSSAILIFSQGGLLLFLFSRMIRVVGNILPIRGGTILKMLGSLVSYLTMAFLIYRCMICFGLNPTALMASAGIVSVVLGIGANSLVGDILAGIFILMEGNVQVGDVIRIGDFRGYVMELGIRMTKVFDMDTEDVKIIPNNEVRNVVHMTMRTSIVYSEFQIRYEEKLESVERILAEELKRVKNKSPLILNGPVYIGVSRLDSSGVVLKTATRCHESSRLKVEREVNHIVYSIFQKNQISVPYPQVTVHPGDGRTVEREEPFSGS